MNLKLQDEVAFFAEYQNEPLPEQAPDADLLTADQITEKVNGFEQGVIPLGCNHITMFIDVQQSLLYYLVAAWEDNFTGYVVDYGVFPDQQREYFTLRDVRHTLQSATGLSGKEAATVEPARKTLTETRDLERRLSDLVNEAYGLTPTEVDLMWRTAPPRMPISR